MIRPVSISNISNAIGVTFCALLLCLLAVIETNAATFTVTNTNDSGAGSLRQAITSANGTSAVDTINFNIAGSGVKTIAPLSALPEITAPVIIDGTTQSGWAAGNLVIEISGENAGANTNGIRFFNIDETAAASIVRGLAVNRFTNAGIYSNVSSNITIEGCHIGTDPTGIIARPNFIGILMEATIGGFISFNNTIGGDTVAERNVISGNSFLGIRIFGSTQVFITGNYIGPDKTGMVSLGDQVGVEVTGTHVTIGGNNVNLRNVISGNVLRGITLNGLENTVQGNFIGVAADGVTPMGNSGNGIQIIGNGLTNNDHLIGGLGAGEGNVIAYNNSDGVGVFRDSNPTDGHRIIGNSIFSNGALGIDLDDNGITPNDTGDADTGTNNLQNYPVLTSATVGTTNTNIAGTFNSEANTSYRIDLYVNDANKREGKTFLGSQAVTTDASGNATVNATVSALPLYGQFVTATATRTVAPLDTSEFSAPVAVTLQTFVVTNTNNSGSGSLRQAMLDAEANANPNLISFAITPLDGSVKTINLTSALPAINNRVAIDGLTQNGATCSSPKVEINGTAAGSGVDGFTVNADNVMIQGLVINRFPGDGIFLDSNLTNVIRCNKIGTSADGSVDLGNGGNGILNDTSHFNLIESNTISGNGLTGIRASFPNNNTIVGNIIGLNSDASGVISNTQGGILVLGGTGNVIGGTTAAKRNVISGNGLGGVFLSNSGANAVKGNYIGVDASGGGAGFGNTGSGIFISSGFADDNTIGGTENGAGNLIAFNTADGISLASTAGTGNRISNNSIYGNGDLAIDIGDNGVTLNDANDTDAGANNQQNYPVITSASTFTGLGTVVAGTFNSTANTSFRIEFFTNPSCDPSGSGEGQTFIGYLDVSTDGSGNAAISGTLPVAATVGQALTSTATRGATPYDTSEFSVCRVVSALVPPSVSVTNTNDSGAGSLRQAIISANGDTAPNTISFNIGGGGLKTITPLTPLPAITTPVIVDGLAQPGATCSLPLIELNGASAGAGVDGLDLSGGNSVVRGIIVNRFGGDGIEFLTKGGNAVKCTRVGTDQAGLSALPNGANGIFLNNIDGNTIGGTESDGNLISGNTLNGILIDGSTAPASGNLIQGNLIGVNSLGIVSAGIGNTQDGIRIVGVNATNNTIGGSVTAARNVISNNGDDGIETATAASATVIKGNYIGVTSGGNGDAGNADRGIISNGTTTVGGTIAAERNVISANVVGIQVAGSAANTTIQGNYFGLGADGTTSLGNTLGIFLNNTNNSQIGGTAPGAGNVISANSDTGISLDGENNNVQGNLIGTDATGTLDRGNGSGNAATGAGLSLNDRFNTIGGSTAAARNVISGNNFGIFMGSTSASDNIIRNNLIGVDINGTNALGNSRSGILVASNNNIIGGGGEGNIIAFNVQNGIGVGSTAVGNRISANSIYSNNLMGIDLGNNGVFQANDNLDPDTGSNNLQNFPVINVASANTIIGTFNSTASTTFTLEFFLSLTAEANGHGEGRTFLGSIAVATDASGNSTFSFFSSSIDLPNGQHVTATATNNATGDTSEFSQSRQIVGPTAGEVSVTGRVINESGRGIVRTSVVLVGPDGNAKTILTNPFGYFRFSGVTTGSTYVLQFSSKSYVFEQSSIVITVTDAIDDLILIGRMPEQPESMENKTPQPPTDRSTEPADPPTKKTDR